MRGPLSFTFATLSLLFFLQGLTVLVGVLFALVYQGIFPELHSGWLLLALPAAGALLASALPLSRWVERGTALAWACAAAAIARVPLSLPAFWVRYAAAILVVAAGVIFLGKAVGLLQRRIVAAAAAVAFVLDQLLRLAGWSYDISQRPGWWPVQVGLSAVAVVALLAWRSQPPDEPSGSTLERRAGGVRLRGGVALGCVLFLQLNVLARAEVAHRWIGVSYGTAAVALIAAGAIATLLLLAAPGPVGRHRVAALLLTGTALAGALAPGHVAAPPAALLALFAAGHGAGLLLLDRALVPAGGRRRGWRLAAGLATLLALTIAWALTFYYAFTLALFAGRTAAIVLAAAALCAAALVFTPRPSRVEPVLRSPAASVAVLVILIAAAALLARRPRPVAAAVPEDVGVATYNIHYGFGEDWVFHLERIAGAIEATGADVVALQEVPAGLLTAYGADVPLWLGRRLGMRELFAPSINGLLGETILTRLPVLAFGSEPLPPPGSDRKVLAHALLDAGRDTLAVFAVHLGIVESEQRPQLAAVLPFLLRRAPAVLMGDLNAAPESFVARALRQAGFRDAFEAAGRAGAPTWPASRPVNQIDWIWVRGYGVEDAAVSAAAGSDHRLVSATLMRPR